MVKEHSLSFTIAHLRTLLAHATKGPWTAWLREDYDPARFLSYRQKTVIGANELGYWEHLGTGNDREDAALIVAAINALPDLLAIAEKAEAFRKATDDAYLADETGVQWDEYDALCDALSALNGKGK